MELSVPTNEFEEKIHANIRKYGYQYNVVSDPDNKDPMFAYTIGFWATYNHPEIIVFGLHSSVVRDIFHLMSECLAQGLKPYELDEAYSEFINGYECVFKAVPSEKSAEYLLSSRWLYVKDDFPVMQLVFQDENHQYPWDNNACERFRRNQPILGFIY